MKKLVIIPAYNEADNIIGTVRDVMEQAPEFDYVVINDCSKDQTRQVCEREGFTLINLPMNLGIGGGVQTGYQYALSKGYDLAVQFDGDGQHDARYLNEMARILCEEKADMVIGSRFIEKTGFQSSAARRMGIRYFTGLIRLLSGQTITDPTSGYRMCNRRVIELFAENYPKDYPEPETNMLLLKQNYKVLELPMEMHAREHGVSSISPRKSVYYMVKVSIAILMEACRRGKKA